MLTLAEVRLRRGPQVLIDAATGSIFRGENVGIVVSPLSADLPSIRRGPAAPERRYAPGA